MSLFVAHGVSGLPVSSAISLYMKLKENSGNSSLCHSLDPEIPSQFSFFFHPSESYVCFV